MTTLLGLLMVAALIGIYFLPAIIARMRRHLNRTAILVLNLLLGWTLLGWAIAAVWAFTDKVEQD